jgi:hypothetical protein
MNRKSFLILLVLVAILGGAGLFLLKQDEGAWRGSGAKPGARPFEKAPVNDVAQIRLKDGTGEVTLVDQGGRWTVKERGDYRANHQDVGDLLVKLPEAKVVQSETVGATLLPRLNLVEPGKSAKPAEAGTQLELSDKGGKPLASILLGKKVIKTEPSPLPIKQETPVGRYVLVPGNPTVMVLSEPFNMAEAKPARWLAKDFFKVERVKLVEASGEGGAWRIARSEEAGQWKFGDGAGQLDPSAAVAIANGLASISFSDVAPGLKIETLEKVRTVVAETFDGLVYTLKLAKKPDGSDYYLTMTVAGEPPRERKPEPGEKPEDKARLDKYFAESLKKLDERLKLEKDLAAWTYVVPAKALEPLLKERAQLVAVPRQPPGPGPGPGFGPGR